METQLAAPHPSDPADKALIAGIGITLIGLVAVSVSLISSLMTMWVLGAALAAAAGVVAFQSRARWRTPDGWVELLSALLLLGVGVLLVFRPVTSLKLVTPVLYLLFLVDGAVLLATALRRREGIWIVQALTGAALLASGVVLAVRWQSVGLGLVGALVGVQLIGRGVMFIAASVVARARVRDAPRVS